MKWMVIGVLAALAACGGDGDGDSGTDHDHHDMGGSTGLDYSTEAMTDGGSYSVMYVPSVDPIPLSEPFELTVSVMDPTSGDVVMADDMMFTATMPSHGHGMNTEPQVVANDDGTFGVTGMLLHMEGWWEMTVDVSVMGTTERATFNVDCCQ
jgi:hypothetical protein